MLARIGRGPAGTPDEDLVAPLLACHERIRAFCATAARLSTPRGAGPEEIAEAAAAVERYFRVALPLHVEDEDLSILPRLASARAPAPVLAAAAAMAREHGPIEEALAGLCPRWAELGQDPTALPRLAAGLQADTARLAALLDAHLAGEEAIVFPAVREHLSADAPAIRAEMRARRAR